MRFAAGLGFSLACEIVPRDICARGCHTYSCFAGKFSNRRIERGRGMQASEHRIGLSQQDAGVLEIQASGAVVYGRRGRAPPRADRLSRGATEMWQLNAPAIWRRLPWAGCAGMIGSLHVRGCVGARRRRDEHPQASEDRAVAPARRRHDRRFRGTQAKPPRNAHPPGGRWQLGTGRVSSCPSHRPANLSRLSGWAVPSSSAPYPDPTGHGDLNHFLGNVSKGTALPHAGG